MALLRRDSPAEHRRRMVAQQLRARGVQDPAVLAAMESVARELFVPRRQRSQAYADGPLPIGGGQTISQPYIVALMCAALELGEGERVLEVGAGSGYAAAVMSMIVGEVYALELHPRLAARAARVLAREHFDRVHLRAGDGSLGWPEHAPFDAISAAAASPTIPPALLEQLAVGGRLVLPLGGPHCDQELVKITREGPRYYRHEKLADVRFVPLVR